MTHRYQEGACLLDGALAAVVGKTRPPGSDTRLFTRMTYDVEYHYRDEAFLSLPERG